MMKINRDALLKVSFSLLWIGFYFAYAGASNENNALQYVSLILFGLACACAVA